MIHSPELKDSLLQGIPQIPKNHCVIFYSAVVASESNVHWVDPFNLHLCQRVSKSKAITKIDWFPPTIIFTHTDKIHYNQISDIIGKMLVPLGGTLAV